MKTKQGKKSAQKTQPAKPAKPVKEQESSGEDDDDSSEELPKPVTTTPQKKQEKMEVGESNDSDESDEEVAPAVAKKPGKSGKPAKKSGSGPATKTGKTTAPKKKQKEEASSDEDGSSEEETKVPAKPTGNKKIAPTPVAKEEEDSSEEEDEEDESSGEEDAPELPAKAPETKDESDEEEDSEEEENVAPNGKSQDDSDEDEDDDDEEDDDDDDDEDDDEDAQKPGEKRKGKQVKGSAKKPKIEIEENKGLELFVKGLPEGVEEKKLTKFFKKENVKVESIKMFDGKNICFVHLSEEMTKTEVDKINGSVFDGSSLTIELAQKRDKSSTTPKSGGKEKDGGGDRNERDKRTLFVKNLPYGTDEDALSEYFKGSEEVRLPRNDDGKIRGICFVQFSSEAEALKALKKYSDVEFGGRKLSINQAGNFGASNNNSFGGSPQPNQYADRDKRSLFVGNLSYGVDEGSVTELFEGCKDVRIPKRDDGKIKGYAFVEYETEADAVKAMGQFQGSDLDGREISIERCSEKQSGGGRGRGGRGGGGRGFGGRGGGGRGGGGRGGRGGFDRGRGGRGGRGGFRGGRGGFNS